MPEFCPYLITYDATAQESNLWGKFCRLMVRCGRHGSCTGFAGSIRLDGP